MDRLRGEKGCPWDLEQTHKSLMPYLIEETFETIEAIEEEDSDRLCEELGDLMLQIVFHARIAKESGKFEISNVLNSSISSDTFSRTPSIFSQSNPTWAALSWIRLA